MDPNLLSIGREIGRGKRGSVHEGNFEGRRVAIKLYHAAQRPMHRLSRLYRDEAKTEYRRLSGLRARIGERDRGYFQDPVGVASFPDGREAFISALVVDYDGSVSKNVVFVADPPADFLPRVETALQAIMETDVLFRPSASNFVVRRVAPDSAEPVLVDFENVDDYRHFPTLFLRRVVAGKATTKQLTGRWCRRLLAKLADPDRRILTPQGAPDMGSGPNSDNGSAPI